LLQLFDPGDGDVTRSTFEAMLMSWRCLNVSVW